MPNSLRQILEAYSEIFCVKLYKGFQKQPVGGAFIVLAKSLKTVFDEVLLTVNLLYQNSVKAYEDDLKH